MDCIFCKIAEGIIPSSKVYEDEAVLAFHDLSPQAPVHVLVIPKTHVASLDEVTGENSAAVTAVMEAIPKVARLMGLGDGYRVITNIGENGAQSVRHLHFHVLGGTKLPEKIV